MKALLAMIVQRLITPASKLGTTREWHTTTLAEELGVAEATEDDLYQAMDWLLARKERIRYHDHYRNPERSRLREYLQ